MDKIAAAIVVLSDSQQCMMGFQQQFMEQQWQAQFDPNRERSMERKLQLTTLMIAPFNDTEDIQDFLDAFETTMQLQEIEEDQWRLPTSTIVARLS